MRIRIADEVERRHRRDAWLDRHLLDAERDEAAATADRRTARRRTTSRATRAVSTRLAANPKAKCPMNIQSSVVSRKSSVKCTGRKSSVAGILPILTTRRGRARARDRFVRASRRVGEARFRSAPARLRLRRRTPPARRRFDALPASRRCIGPRQHGDTAGFNSRASRMTSSLFGTSAVINRLPACRTPALSSVSRWLASP